ncbi:non-canonical purine NTP pyrophosphatase [Haloglomus halophilum]|uniref:non-canonical purine NTP pyrophosphatase n=1 Tax=Haloglomus halophilum TaxID=2962672 RepID=UPI0020C94072|nr:non-canonical purine NTP pyrophosphatase [Haloglomus halophilum]
MTLRYVTTNPGKVREAEEYLDDVSALDYDYTEVQAPELGPIAAHGAREAYRHAGEPVIVDDAGLFVDALDGFPGPYSSYVEHTLGVELTGRVAREAAAAADGGDSDGDGEVARAAFRCVIGYCDGDDFAATPEPVDRGERRGQDLAADDRDSATTDAQVAGDDGSADLPVKLFEGVVPGRIVEPRGDGGFGYDPVFEHDGTTFAEMDATEKNAVSHRGRALAKFADWFAER